MSTKASIFLLAVSLSLGSQGATAPEPPTSVSLCSLLSRPADYDGKEVRVRARYHIGFEYSYLHDPSCKEYAVETTPYRNGRVVWTEFAPSVETNTGPEIYGKFTAEASLCCPDGWRDTEAELVVTGTFFRAKDGGYGHMGRYALELVIDKVEEVNATEKK